MKKITRRSFICASAAALSAAAPANAFWPFSGDPGKDAGPEDVRGEVFKGDAPDKPWKWSKEAYFYTKLAGGRVMCGVCPHRCRLSPGDRSVCRSRVNIDGVLYSLVYGNPCAIHVDPIEKKPLYHYKPRSRAFSVATTGCNFRCLNCQNWEISQAKPHEVRRYEMFPGRVVEQAEKAKCASIAYTYSEPITFFEYTLDTARLAREKGLGNVLVSNGYINKKPLLEFCKVFDGANVNLKSFSDALYRKLNGGRLEPMLRTFKTLHERGVHFEMTNLVVPDYVDDPEMVKRMCHWIIEELGPDHPLHFLRFFPRYKLDRLPPTPVATLARLREIAMEIGIRYVYLGNVPDHEGNNTWCHSCKKLLIERRGYFITTNHLKGSRCEFCDAVIPGVWEEKPAI
ncbi:MAG: AmmeMemoRadiSam system radical SAM enzyme [Desulfobacterales bacterium]|nr:AmmeMemoRadiSam system radical SAM enzyme [Desulfobacterales bacterium]